MGENQKTRHGYASLPFLQLNVMEAHGNGLLWMTVPAHEVNAIISPFPSIQGTKKKKNLKFF